MTRTYALGCAILVVSACADGEASNASKASEPAFGTIRSDWRPLRADELYEGKSLAEWGVAYARYSYAQTSCDAPSYDQTGELCELYQDPESPAFILEYSPTDRVRTKCRIPAGKAIVVPVISASIDNAGRDELWSEDEMLEILSDALDSMRDLKLQVDGADIEDMQSRKVEPTRFEYTLPAAPNWYSCNGQSGVEDTTVSPSFFAGYVAVFPPPEPGVHELQYGGVLTYEGDEYAIDTRTRFVVED